MRDYYFVEASTAYDEIHDEDIEEEFHSLQMEINSKKNQAPTKNAVDGGAEVSEETDALSSALSNLHVRKSEAECLTEPVGTRNMSKEGGLEAA